MKISERGQITIPKPLRDRFGLYKNVEIEMLSTKNGIR
jgi:AbrB family looped-hinge helix DNA binding protein